MAETFRTSTWLSQCSNATNTTRTNDYRCLAIFYGKIIAASLSLAGCCLTLFMIVLYKKYRCFTNRMIMYLLLPSLLLSSIYVYPHKLQDDSLYCQITGYLINVCTLAQRALILCIVIHLVVFSVNQSRPKYMEHIFVILVCTWSLLISSIPFISAHSHYGYAGVWCWIKADTRYENLLRLFCMYFWLLVFIAVEFACFIVVIIKVRKHLQQIQAACPNSSVAQVKIRQYKKQVYPLLCYPIVNTMLALPVCANRLQNWLDPDKPVFGLYLAHCIIYPLWGFCNAMMYFVNKETIRELHPSSVWERLTSWRLSSSQQRLWNPGQTPQTTQPEPDDKCVQVNSRITIGAEAVHSATLDSSDME